MTNQIVPVESNFMAPAAALNSVLQAYQAKKDFIAAVLVEGVDFGTIPGAGDKPTLKKPGAEKLVNFFGMYPTFDDIVTIEDWSGTDHGGEPLFYYRQRANLWRIINGERVMVASADGSCNSWEKKYRYRQAERTCPKCGKNAIIKGKEEYGGGWICFTKKGGCNAKYTDNDTAITGQQVGQIKNPDVFELTNTILKMAQKRALVAAALIGTCASDYFTQDIDDYATEGEYVAASKDPFVDHEQPRVSRPAPEPVEHEKPANGNNPVQALVDANICENAAAAAQLLNRYVPANIRSNTAEVVAWGRLYRGWRDMGSEPAAAAENATNKINPQ